MISFYRYTSWRANKTVEISPIGPKSSQEKKKKGPISHRQKILQPSQQFRRQDRWAWFLYTTTQDEILHAKANSVTRPWSFRILQINHPSNIFNPDSALVQRVAQIQKKKKVLTSLEDNPSCRMEVPRRTSDPSLLLELLSEGKYPRGGGGGCTGYQERRCLTGIKRTGGVYRISREGVYRDHKGGCTGIRAQNIVFFNVSALSLTGGKKKREKD